MGFFDLNDMFANKEIDKSLLKPKETVQDSIDKVSNSQRIWDNIKKFQTGKQYDDLSDYRDKVVEEALFKTFKPTDKEWKWIWEAHPELQNDMLAFYDELQNERRSQFKWCVERQQRIPIAVCERYKEKDICKKSCVVDVAK